MSERSKARVAARSVALAGRVERELFADIDRWWAANAAAGRTSLLMGYSFGKAQRILAGVDASIGPMRSSSPASSRCALPKL